MTILLTGASGFVGRALVLDARNRGMRVRPVFRRQELTKCFEDPENSSIYISGLGENTDWSEALVGIDVVIHCAARVHVMHETTSDPLSEFRKVNVGGSLNLARQAAMGGVRRFVFVSSIKVNGESTQVGQAYTADDLSAPEDAYGVSKAEAEVGLRLLSQETGLEVVIIRSPLVYGPGVKGNFASLVRWVARGWPLPLGRANDNCRSLVAVDNLVDLILTCVEHPKAANQTFLVSDGEDLSTEGLLRRIGKAMGKSACLLPVPGVLLVLAASLLGKRAVAQRLLGSLQVDISKTCELLDWKPLVSVDEGLRRAVEQRV